MSCYFFLIKVNFYRHIILLGNIDLRLINFRHAMRTQSRYWPYLCKTQVNHVTEYALVSSKPCETIHAQLLHFTIFSSLSKKPRLSQEAVWEAQMDLIKVQRENALLDRERMKVHLEVLQLTKKTLEKRQQEETEVDKMFPVNDLMNILATSKCSVSIKYCYCFIPYMYCL